MKPTTLRWYLLFLLLTLFSISPAMTKQMTPASISNEGEMQSIKEALIALSKQKWLWMANKKVNALEDLFNDKSMFIHMGGTWGKEQELDIIESGAIHYKKADVYETSVQIIDKTAILLNRITLLAVVGGREVTNNFMVTEVYVLESEDWTLGSLSFTKLLD